MVTGPPLYGAAATNDCGANMSAGGGPSASAIWGCCIAAKAGCMAKASGCMNAGDAAWPATGEHTAAERGSSRCMWGCSWQLVGHTLGDPSVMARVQSTCRNAAVDGGAACMVKRRATLFA